MINYNNNNIFDIHYNGHHIKKAYGCDGHLVWERRGFGTKWVATYSDTHIDSGECMSSEDSLAKGVINLTNLVSAEINDCVVDMGNNYFSGCTTLTNVRLSQNLPFINLGMFDGCTSLASIDIPTTTPDKIGDFCFRGCTSLTSVTIPANIIEIDNGAFSGCTNLTSITFVATNPPRLNVPTYTFKDTNNCPIYVPDESVDAYKNKTTWSRYADRIKPVSEKP